MKKKLALIVSIVLVLSAMVCLLVSPTSADVAPYYDAAEVADSIWENAPNKVTSVTYNGNTIPASDTEASLVDLNIGFTAGTYTLVDGVLTLNNVAVATPNLGLVAAGSLKLVINGADLNATVSNGADPNPYGDLLITSETGNKLVADAHNAIRTSGNLVVYGNVGLALNHTAHDGDCDAPIVVDNYGVEENQQIILCPEVDSTVSVTNNYAMRNERGGIVLGGSANLNIVTPAYHAVKSSGDVEILGTGSVTFDADYRLFPGTANVNISEDVTVSMDTGASTCFQENNVSIADNAKVTITAGGYAFEKGNVAVGDNAEVAVNGSSALTYGQKSDSERYTFTVSDNAKVSMGTSASHTLYAYNTTIRDNAEVVLKTASDNAIHNSSLDISGNAVVSVHTDSTSGAVIYGVGAPLSVTGNATLNVTGTAANGIYLHYSALTVADNATVNMDVTASNAIALQDYAPVNITGGAVNMMGTVTNSAISALPTSPVSITGGTVNMMVPDATSFFYAPSGTGTSFTIGKDAIVSGVAGMIINVPSASVTANVTFEPVESGAVSNVALVTTNGTHNVVEASYTNLALNDFTGGGRIHTNLAAAAPSADVAVKVTDANGTTELSAASPYYNGGDYGSVVYLPSSNTLYVDNINIVRLETLVDCNLLLVGTNKISNPNANGRALVSSVAGKNLSIGGFNATLELVANGDYSFALSSAGALSIDGVTVTVAAEGSYAVHVDGDVSLTDADLTVAATADTAFRAKAALNVTDSKVVVTAGGQIATSVSGVVTINGSEFSSSTPGQQGLFCSALVVKDSVVTGASTGSYYGIYAASFINIENSDVTAQGGSSNALVSNGTLTVTDSVLTATAPGTVVNISGDINVKNSTVTATATNGSYTFASTAGNVTIDNSVMNISTVGSEGGIAAAAGTLTIQGANSMVTSQDSAYYALRAKNLVIKDGAQVVASTTASETVNAIETISILSGASVESTAGTHYAIHTTGGTVTIDSATVNATSASVQTLYAQGNTTISGTASVTLNGAGLVLYADGYNLTVKDDAVVNVVDTGSDAVSATSIDVLDNAVINASGTAGIYVRTALNIASGATVNLDATTKGIDAKGGCAINVKGTLNIGANTRPSKGISVDSGVDNTVSIVNIEGTANIDAIDIGIYTPGSINVTGSLNIGANTRPTEGIRVDSGAGNKVVFNGSTSVINTAGYAANLYAGLELANGANVTFNDDTNGYGLLIDGDNNGLTVSGGSTLDSNMSTTANAYGIYLGYRATGANQNILITGNSKVYSDCGNMALRTKGGSITISDSEVITKTWINNNNVYSDVGNISISNSTVSSTGSNTGNALIINAAGTLSITNGSNVTATATNGNYAVHINGLVTVDDSTLTASAKAGYAIRAKAGLTADGSTITATSSDGGYTVSVSGDLTANDSTLNFTGEGRTLHVTGNLNLTASDFNGVAYDEYLADVGGNMVLDNTDFYGDANFKNGVYVTGGISINNGSHVEIDSEENWAFHCCQDLIVDNSELLIDATGSNVLVKYGTADADIIIRNGSKVTVTGSSDVVVSQENGGLVVTDSTLTATATSGTYAVYAYGAITVDASDVYVTSAGHTAFRKYASGAGDFRIQNGSYVEVTSGAHYALAVDNADLYIIDSEVKATAVSSYAISAGNEYADGNKNIIIENSTVNATTTDGYYAIRATGDISISDSSDVYAKTGTSWTVSNASGNISIDKSNVEIDCATTKGLATNGALTINESIVNVEGGGDVVEAYGKLTITDSDVTATAEGSYALYGYADFTIEDSTVVAKSNTAHRGIAMFNNGTLTIKDSDVTAEVATSHAIMADTGNVVIENSNITAKAPGNQDALAAPEGTLTVIDSELDLDARYYSIRANVVDITNSLVDANNSESYVIKASGVVTFTDSEIYAIAGTHTSIEVGSLNVLGSTHLVSSATTHTIFADSVTFAGKTETHVTSTAPQAWQAPIQTANLTMEDDAEVYVTVDQTTANASNVLVAVRIDPEATPTTEATMNLNGGKLDIVVNNAYADANGKDSGDNRTYAIFVKGVAADGVNINGTDITVDLNTKVQNGPTGGILVHQNGGIGPAVINFAKGSITAYAGPNIWNMFYSDISGSQFIVGEEAEIYGSARYFFRVADGTVVDQNVTVKPGAKIDFYSYVKTHDLGAYNNTNLTYYNSYTDKGVEYLNGCALADNGNFLTTANVSKEGDATQVSVILKDGTVVALSTQDAQSRRYPADAPDGAELLRFYTDGEGWIVAMNGVQGTKFDANGHVGINLIGDNEIISTGMFAVYSRGELRILGDGTLNVEGTQYVIYAGQNGITVSEDATVNGYGTEGTVIHVARQDPISFLHITDNAKVSVSSEGTSHHHAPIYLPGYNPTVIIDGNAVVDVEGQAAGIYVLGDSPNSVYEHEGVASINIGGNAKVTSAAGFALYGYGGNVEVNIYGKADVDLLDSNYGIRMYGANLYTSISDKANVLIDAPTADGIGMTSETVSEADIDNAAVLDVSGDAVLKIKDAGALGVRAMIDPNVKDKNDNALVGDVAMIVSDNANVDITSAGQAVYLAAVAEGSTGTFGMFDSANVSLVNQDVTGAYGSALTVYSAENNVEILSDGKLTAEGHAANWTAAFFVNAPEDGKTTVNIIDTKVDVTNISNCAIDEKGFASDVSIAFCIAGEGVFTIGGDAVVNGYAEKNGEEEANRAFGLYLHPDMTMKVQDNAKATFGAGGDSETSKGAGIHVNNSDIVVTDNATLKATADGTALAAMIFEKKATMVVNGKGWVDIDGGEVGGIRGATQSSKPVITVDEGGLVTIKGAPAYSKKGGKFTFKVHSALAGDDKASSEEVDASKLTGKEGYIRLNGKNPNTSDFVVISVAIAAILAVAVAAAVIVIRRRKVQE